MHPLLLHSAGLGGAQQDMFSRKRSRNHVVCASTANNKWWEQCLHIMTTKISTVLPSVFKICSDKSVNSIILQFPVHSRIPLNTVFLLEQALQAAGSVCLLGSAVVRVVDNVLELCLVAAAPATEHQSKKQRADQKKSAAVEPSSPWSCSLTSLTLKNKEIYEQLEDAINIVCTGYHIVEENETCPYELIYHKKHNQIITRFKLSNTNPELKLLKGFPSNLVMPWIEYNKKRNHFVLVAVMNECV